MPISSALGSSALLPAGLGFRNKIINGDFRINQRAFTSSTTNGGYGFDRWLMGADAGATYSAQTFTVGNAISGYEPTNFARIVTSGQTGGNYAQFVQRIEDVRTFAGQSVSISFWAKAASGTPKVAIELQQNFGSGGSPSGSVLTYVSQVTLSTSWTRYVVQTTVPSISGKTLGSVGHYFSFAPFVSAGTGFESRTGSLGIQNNTFDFWGVQLEQNYQPTPFEQRPIGVELALCQRYYEKSYDLATAVGNASAVGWVTGSSVYTSTTSSFIGEYVTYKVPKRATPTITIYDAAGTINACQRWTLGVHNTNGQPIYVDSVSSQNSIFVYSSSGTAGAGIGFHYVSVAEL
jgi:hypothetical protein